MNKGSLAENLRQSSHTFWREATENAIRANDGEKERWHFALLHLALATEHTLKAHLASIHPSLIREKLEEPKKSVSILGAVQRLKDSDIGGVHFSDKEEGALRRAADLRNGIAHGQKYENVESVRASFTYIMAFVRAYQFQRLKIAFSDVVSQDQVAKLMLINEQVAEFEKRATESLIQSQARFDSKEVFICFGCGNTFKTIEEEFSVCHFCQDTEEIKHCQHCDRFVPASHLEDFTSQFDYYQEDGRSWLANSYGYDYSECCIECIEEVKQDIRQTAYDAEYAQYMEDVLMDSKR